MKSFALLVSLATIASTVRTDAVHAQAIAPADAPAQRCGWSAPPADARLPANVEQIISRLPAGWKDAGDVVANLNAWYQQCDGGAARRAIFDLKRAVERHRGDQAIAALYGTALMHGPEVQMEGATGVTNRPTFHMSNSERDGSRLLAAAALTSGLEVAAIELANVALATRHEPTVRTAVDALNKVTAAAGTAAHWRLLAELSFVNADYATARSAGERAVSLGDAAALHAVGLARVMADTDTAAAAAAYLGGLAASEALDVYYDDLSYLLLASDTTEWLQLRTPAQRAEWITKQWQWRAATGGQSVAERLKVHFTRLAHAIDHYPREAFSTPAQMNSVVRDQRTRRMTLDDRGLIYIRHGEPDAEIRMRTRAADRYRVAWGYYGLGEGAALFEFTKNDCSLTGSNSGGLVMKCTPTAGYYLATPVPCDHLSPEAAAATYHDYGSEISPFDRALSGAMIGCYMANVGGSDMLTQQLRGFEHRRNSITEGLKALRTESAARDLKAPISTLVNTYAMRVGTETRLFAFTAIDGATISPRPGTSEYALRMLLSIEDASTRTAQQVDTTRSFRTPAPMTGGQIARATLSVAVAAKEDVTVRMTVRNPNNAEQGQIVTTARSIPDFSNGRYALSDLVIADPAGGSWMRSGVGLAPLPAHQVGEGETFLLFNEVYGAQTGDSLTVQITIAPGESENVLSRLRELISKRSAQQISFNEPATVDARGVMPLSREVGADLEPGRYVVNVSVRNARLGTTAAASTHLIVLGQQK